jgi:hypothetical protein
VYEWEGFWRVEEPPSPKSQVQDEGFPPERSVNCTVRGTCPLNGDAVKSAERVGATVVRVTVTLGETVVVGGAMVVTGGRVVVGVGVTPDPPFPVSMGPATV